MAMATENLIDRGTLGRVRQELGANFGRILGYFREDGIKSVAAIEAAMRDQNAAALVLPAHTLKGESRMFGADVLADLAEGIESIARDCVEMHDTPAEALQHVIELRPTFDATLVVLEREVAAVPVRRTTGFGRRIVTDMGRAE